MFNKGNITFVLPGRNRSGGVRVTVEMANRLIDIGYEVRIAYRAKKRFTAVWARSIIENVWLGINGYDHTDWTDEYKGKLEKYIDLQSLVFSEKEIVIAVGMHTIKDVYSLNADVIKIRYNHGFSLGVEELTNSAWGLPMPTIVVASTLIPRMEKLSGQKARAVIPNGINTTEYFIENGSTRDGIGIMYSSHPNKEPKDIIKLAQRIEAKWACVPQYYYGTDEMPKALRTGIYKRFPSVEQARKIYNRCMVWLSVSREEGFCLPILEAMACGCVVISSDNLGAKELIRNGENGYLVPTGDIDSFLVRVEQVLNNTELREYIVQKGLETVKAFSWETAVAKMDSFLNDIRNSYDAIR